MNNLYDEAVRDYKTGNYTSAEVKFDMVLESNPQNYFASVYKGCCVALHTDPTNPKTLTFQQATTRIITSAKAMHDTCGDSKEYADFCELALANMLNVTTAMMNKLTPYLSAKIDESVQIFLAEKQKLIRMNRATPYNLKVLADQQKQMVDAVQQLLPAAAGAMSVYLAALGNGLYKNVTDINTYPNMEKFLDSFISFYNALSVIGESNKGSEAYNDVLYMKTKLEKILREKKERERRQKEAERKAAEEALKKAKKQRWEAYWAEHAEEKKEIESHINSIKNEIAELDEQIEGLNNAIGEANRELRKANEEKPSEIELKKVVHDKNSLYSELSGLNFFQGKRKKEINNTIDELTSKELILKEEREKINKHREEVKQKTDQIVSENKNKIKPLDERRSKLKKEKDDLEYELKKDR